MNSPFSRVLVWWMRCLAFAVTCLGCCPASAAIGWTSYAATYDTYYDKVRVSYSVAVADCSSNVPFRVTVYRNSVQVHQTMAVSGSWDDTSATAGVAYTYYVTAEVTNGGACAVGQKIQSPDLTGRRALPTPPQAFTISGASDGAYGDRVRISYVRPDISSNCSGANHVLVRNGFDINTFATGVGPAGASFVDDLSAAPGVSYSYAIRSDCTSTALSSTSSSDSGYAANTPPPSPTSISASDGALGDRISITVVVPASPACASRNVIVARGGADIQTLTGISSSGGSSSFDDTTAGFGVHTYTARSVCQSTGVESVGSVSDTGFKKGTPQAPTSMAASDYLYSDRVQITANIPGSPECGAISAILSRDGVDIDTDSSFSTSGGSYSFADTGVAYGLHTYRLRIVCTPGGTASSVVADSGARLGVPPAPGSITASDYAFVDRVHIVVNVPAAPMCTTRDVVIARDGVDITTITGVSISGGIASFDDSMATLGTHTYTARSRCNPGGAESGAVSDDGTKAHAAATCAGVSLPSGPITFSADGSVPVTVNGIANAVSTRIEVFNSQGGPDDLQSYPVVGSPSGTASVLLANHASGAPQYGVMNVRVLVTGSNPGEIDVECASGNVTVAPAAPSNFRATDGSLTNQVGFTWDAIPRIGSYAIYQCPLVNATAKWSNPDNTGSVLLDGKPCTPVLTAIPASATSALLEMPGSAHEPAAFVIHAVSTDGSTNTALSTADGGYPNRAPVSASATASIKFGTTEPLATSLKVVDANPSDFWDITLASSTTLNGGTVQWRSGNIMYTPPSASFMGTDSFEFNATDSAGASVLGSGQVVVDCPAPSVSEVTTSPALIFPGTAFVAGAAYGNSSCAQNHDATATLLYNGASVAEAILPSIRSTDTGLLTFNMPPASSPGFYTLRVTVKNTVSGLSAFSDRTFRVSSYELPTAVIAPRALEQVQPLSLVVSGTADCPLTTDSSAAAVDPTKCLVSVTGLPVGLSLDAAASTPTWRGIPTVPGTYPITVAVSQFDVTGVPKVIGKVEASTQVLPLSSMVFTAPTPIRAKQYLETVQSSVAQSAGVACPLTEDVALAQSTASAGGLRCLLVMDSPPSGFSRVPFGISGSAYSPTLPLTKWKVSVFNSTGVEFPVSAGSIALDVVPTSLSYNVLFNPRAPVGSLSNVTGSVLSTGSDSCTVTTDEKLAKDKARTTCLWQWTSLPTGLSQAAGTSDPLLRGVLVTPGSNSVSYKVSIFDPAQNPVEVFAGSAAVNVSPPPSPTVNISNQRVAAPGIYTVPIDGGFYAVLSNCTGCGAISYTQTTAGDSVSRSASIVSPTGRASLTASASSLYTQRATTLRVALSSAPTVFEEQTFSLLSVPPDDTKLTISIPSATVPDTRPVEVTANVGRYTKDGFVYTASHLGAWRIRFGVIDSAGTFQPMTGYISTDASGSATGSISPTGFVFMRLVAQAESITPVVGYSQTIKSSIRVATVVKGSLIDATVSASAVEGPAPLISSLKLSFATRADQLANESILWQSSSDGGVSWTDITDASGSIYWVRAPAGVTAYRARLKNRNTGDYSYTESVALTAWDIPRVVVSGPSYAFPGSSLTLSAIAQDASGSLVAGAVFDWSIGPRPTTSMPSPPALAAGSGDEATFTPTAAGLYVLKFRARYPTSPDSDPRSWMTSSKQIVVDAAQKPVVRIAGPVRAEVGRGYDFTASLSAPFPIASSPHTLSGQWTLPDGTTVPGTSLSWTPTASDLARSSSPSLRYSAWVAGYESESTVTVNYPVRLWQYVFPSWSISGTRSSTYSPTNFSFVAVPANASLVAGLEGLTYTWSVPPGLAVLGSPSNKLNATAVAGGTYTVSLTVSDSRGNTQTIDSTQSASDPPPFDMTLAVTKVSRWSHAPLIIGVTPKVSGGHPSDSIVTWTYSVDGAQQTGLPNRSGVQISLPDAQVYQVQATAVSAMGATVSKSVFVTVPTNVPPTCSISAKPSANRLMVSIKAVCSDPDGLITGYRWSVNGVARPENGLSNWTYYLPDGSTLPILIGLTVTDDGGSSTTAELRVD